MIDAYDMWESHDAEQEKRLARLPVCDICGEPLQEDFYRIDDRNFCKECLDDYFLMSVEIGGY